jgi:hypothetical protein
MTTNGTALARMDGQKNPPALTDQQLRRRLQVAHSKGFGLQDATNEQLEQVYLLCQRYRLDPELHLTLFRGRPFVTIDGRVELAKRNPDYLDFRTRPLTKDEKDAWDYARDDLVVECTIRCRSGASFAAMGKVTAAERKGQTPAATHPQEMAVKRAFARTARLAFGQSAYLDEDDVLQEQEPDSDKQAQLAQRYTEIFSDEEDADAAQLASGGQPEEAKAASKQREMELAEIDRQRREEGLIQ